MTHIFRVFKTGIYDDEDNYFKCKNCKMIVYESYLNDNGDTFYYISSLNVFSRYEGQDSDSLSCNEFMMMSIL
jgi:hypothetical protein